MLYALEEVNNVHLHSVAHLQISQHVVINAGEVNVVVVQDLVVFSVEGVILFCEYQHNI